MKKEELLEKYYGYRSFRTGQAEVIDSILRQTDVLAVMPTGAGKSVCYQIPALMLPGITLVVSPLISLMKDQVRALVALGIGAAFINSSLTAAQQHLALSRAAKGAYKIIYVAPERLNTPDFLEFALKCPLGLLAIDEAHCISQWGQDFRPSYLKILEFIEKLPARPVIAAFTATATITVREDILRLLKLQRPFELTTGFDRDNLYFEVQKPKDRLATVLRLVRRYQDKSGIIYCATRKTVEQVCAALTNVGVAATRYHAGLPDEERVSNQDDFLYDRKPVMVATNAFGMGIDKSNVSYVVHFNMPKDIESYYQEAGRAGRDGSPAECILLYGGQDVLTHEYLMTKSKENEALTETERALIVDGARERLKQMAFYCTTVRCLRRFILEYFGETTQEYCGSCGNCHTHFVPLDITIDAQKVVSCVGRLHQQNMRFGKAMIVDILAGSETEKLTRLRLGELSTYGAMQSSGKLLIRKILDHLIEQGYLAVSQETYPVVLYGARYREIIAEGKPLVMHVPKEGEHKKKYALVQEHQETLLDALKKLRAVIASEQKVPAYVVFSDATLQDMCRLLPRSLEEFGDVKGVGAKKQAQYGARFLAVLSRQGSFQPEGPGGGLEAAQLLPGIAVEHISFGLGTIAAVDKGFVAIEFEEGTVRKFNLELCVRKNLIRVLPHKETPTV